MSQIQLLGSLTIGPPTVSDTSFPGSFSSAPLVTYPAPKQSFVDSGFTIRSIDSPDDYVVLRGAGSGDAVTQGDTLFVRVGAPMWLRLTFNTAVGDIVSEVPILGTLLLESPTGTTDMAPNYIKQIEIKGTGQVEYLVSGLA